MAVIATCLVSPVLVLVLLYIPAVQGMDHCNLRGWCPDVCCGPRYNATCCNQTNGTNWWRTDEPSEPASTMNVGALVGFFLGIILGGLIVAVTVIVVTVLACKTCHRRPAPAFIIVSRRGRGGYPLVSAQKGYVFTRRANPAVSTEGGQTSGGNGSPARSESVV